MTGQQRKTLLLAGAGVGLFWLMSQPKKAAPGAVPYSSWGPEPAGWVGIWPPVNLSPAEFAQALAVAQARAAAYSNAGPEPAGWVGEWPPRR